MSIENNINIKNKTLPAGSNHLSTLDVKSDTNFDRISKYYEIKLYKGTRGNSVNGDREDAGNYHDDMRNGKNNVLVCKLFLIIIKVSVRVRPLTKAE